MHQEPISVKIGEPYHEAACSGSKRRLIEKQDTYQYVFLLSSLQTLLLDQSVLNQIEQCPYRTRSDGNLQDICDGELFHSHPLFSNNPLALHIIMFYDELELCNPLGTHTKKHKLSIFLFTLGNIEPIHHSFLRVVHLLIAAPLPIGEKHGLHAIMQPLVSDFRTLATKGVTVSVNGVDRTFQGALLLCLGDNLGSNTIGGFKQSFSFAFRFCRTCYITKDNTNPSQTPLNCSFVLMISMIRSVHCWMVLCMTTIQRPMASIHAVYWWIFPSFQCLVVG